MKNCLPALFLLFCVSVNAQHTSRLLQSKWVDSVFASLTPEQKIGQLMVVRLSAIDPVTRKTLFYDRQVADYVRQFDIGGVCLFQGGPLTQLGFINELQRLAQTPILFSVDAENGLGMRMDSVLPLPRQQMLGAVQDTTLLYQYGDAVGKQLRRMGIQMDFAPVIDVNNNPQNPVINDRSFGENPGRVAAYGIQYMKGLQDAGVLACAKHFPGHGDVSVDSHLDLPVISKKMNQMEALELYPFTRLFKAGVDAVMIAHLSVPAIDRRANRPTSLSEPTVTKLLRKKLRFRGLAFTDALEMKGVAKYFPGGDAAVESLAAGNDVVVLPTDLPEAIRQVQAAIEAGRLKQASIDERVKRVLAAKFRAGLANTAPADTANLVADLNRDVPDLYRKVAQKALTLLHYNGGSGAPIRAHTARKIAYIGFGLTGDNVFATRMRNDYGAQVYYFDYSLDSAKAAAAYELLRERYDEVVIGLHNFNRYPANDFGISAASLGLLQKLAGDQHNMTLIFGNPYAAKYVCDAPNLVACYDDNDITQSVAADWLNGKFTASGKLPVTVCRSLPYNAGIVKIPRSMTSVSPEKVGLKSSSLIQIDRICRHAIAAHATPGCVVLVAYKGRIAYEKAFGYLTYDNTEAAYPETIYDLASVTKILATNLSVMKLWEEKKIDLDSTLGTYLPWLRNSNKDTLKLRDVLLHQAGLKSFIPFYEETITHDSAAAPLPGLYTTKSDAQHSVRVAEGLYLRNDWEDTITKRIVESPVCDCHKYVYSDNDFILLGRIVQAVTGKPLDRYVEETFYEPLDLVTTGFHPRDRFPVERIAPTALETAFRKQLLRGDVHDPGAALMGGVSGHAGLFSDAYDMAVLGQMLLNGGTFKGKRYLKKETIDYFSAYHSEISRRGLGFDKPEKDNRTRKEPYPCLTASPETFGHTGFTGTCIWVDPKSSLVYVFLSNRVNPTESPKLGNMNVRGNIMEAIYRARMH